MTTFTSGVLTPGVSHCLQFANTLLELGVIKRGAFTWIDFQHDVGCPTLETDSALDCRGCPWAVINGDTYSFDRATGDVWVSKAVRQ